MNELREIAESLPFDAKRYWLKRGESYFDEERLRKDRFFRTQEYCIIDTLKSLSWTPRHVLELGCGFGRISKRLCEAFSLTSLTGIDLSPDQVEHAHQYCRDSSQATFLAVDIFDVRRFPGSDLCIAIELFLHLTLDQLRILIPRLLAVCPLLIHDFDVDPMDFVSPHIHAHDYDALYRELGLRSEAHVEGEVGLRIVHAA